MRAWKLLQKKAITVENDVRGFARATATSTYIFSHLLWLKGSLRLFRYFPMRYGATFRFRSRSNARSTARRRIIGGLLIGYFPASTFSFPGSTSRARGRPGRYPVQRANRVAHVLLDPEGGQDQAEIAGRQVLRDLAQGRRRRDLHRLDGLGRRCTAPHKSPDDVSTESSGLSSKSPAVFASSRRHSANQKTRCLHRQPRIFGLRNSECRKPLICRGCGRTPRCKARNLAPPHRSAVIRQI